MDTDAENQEWAMGGDEGGEEEAIQLLALSCVIRHQGTTSLTTDINKKDNDDNSEPAASANKQLRDPPSKACAIFFLLKLNFTAMFSDFNKSTQGQFPGGQVLLGRVLSKDCCPKYDTTNKASWKME